MKAIHLFLLGIASAVAIRENPVPARFSPPTFEDQLDPEKNIPNDELMHKIIKDHAVKVGDRWVVKREYALSLAKEMVEKHMKLSGDELNRYMQLHVGDTWAHFDVNKLGHIDAEWMGSFLKRCIKDHTVHIY